jgi:hypothetical protein
MEIIEVNKYDNKVEFILQSYDGKYKAELTKRFIVSPRTRWNFVKQEIEHYFVQHGKRGCLIGSGEDFYSVNGKRYIIHPSEIFIWDLSLIFPDVKFEDNESNITDDVIKVSISTEITEWGTKIE